MRCSYSRDRYQTTQDRGPSEVNRLLHAQRCKGVQAHEQAAALLGNDQPRGQLLHSEMGGDPAHPDLRFELGFGGRGAVTAELTGLRRIRDPTVVL